MRMMRNTIDILRWLCFMNRLSDSPNNLVLSMISKELPEGSWYCLHCTCQLCGDVVNDKEASNSLSKLTCLQCELQYHEMCLKEKGKANVASDIWFCGESCQEVYSGLHSRVGLMYLIFAGFSWTLLRCIHGDQKVHSAQRFVALKAECNIKLAVALTIMEECFLPMVDPRTGINMIPHVLYNLGLFNSFKSAQVHMSDGRSVDHQSTLGDTYHYRIENQEGYFLDGCDGTSQSHGKELYISS